MSREENLRRHKERMEREAAANPITEKECRKCNEVKPALHFSKAKGTKDGLSPYCRVCRRAMRTTPKAREQARIAQKNYRAGVKPDEKDGTVDSRHREYMRDYQKTDIAKANRRKHVLSNPHQDFARSAINNAVRTGRLPRPDSLACSECGGPAKQYHHHNGYELMQVYDVVPVCIDCHSKLDLADST